MLEDYQQRCLCRDLIQAFDWFLDAREEAKDSAYGTLYERTHNKEEASKNLEELLHQLIKALSP